MKAITCEMCSSTNFVKEEGLFICQHCGTKYTVEEAKKLMIEGTVDVQGTVKVDNSSFVQKYLDNAHRALAKEDWEEVEKYYNLVEQNSSNNMEAVFFSSYGKALLSMTDQDYYKREQKFKVLNRSISVLSDYYDTTTENKEEIIKKIYEYIKKMDKVTFVYNSQSLDLAGAINSLGAATGTKKWCINLLNSTKNAFLIELKQISEKHDDQYIKDLIDEMSVVEEKKGCYVATAVYGSYDCPQVWTLRRYRDYTLAETWYGRLFIKLYYSVSPTLVKWFGHTKWFKKMWQGKLDRMVKKLNDEGVENTPYEDRNW